VVLEDFHRRADAAMRLGRAGAERVLETFTWPRVVEAFEGVYDDVLGLASFSPGAPPGAPPRARAAHGRGTGRQWARS